MAWYLRLCLTLSSPLFLLPAGEKEVAEPTGTLWVTLEHIAHQEGCLRLALYADEQAFEAQEPIYRSAVVRTPRGSSVTLHFTDLPFGDYSLALYHDENDNDRLDVNLLGIPTEPFAFSGNPRVKWRKPRYREVVFSFTPMDTLQVLHLKRWEDQ